MTNTDRFNRAIFPDQGIKTPALLASTGNLTLSGEQTIDGSTTSETRVVAKDQTNAWENGVYRTGSGSWTRENDFNGSRAIKTGTLVHVTGGSINRSKFFEVQSTGSLGDGLHNITGSSTGDTVTIGVSDLFAAQQLFGTLWNFDSTTSMADPGSMDLRLNNATLSSVTQIAVSATTLNGTDLSDYIASWDDVTGSNKGTLRIQEAGTPSNFAIFTITGTITDNTTWLQIPVTYVSSGGSFADGDDLVVAFAAAGTQGSGVNESVANNVAVYASTAAVGGSTALRFSAGQLSIGSSGSTAGTIVLASTGGGNTEIRGSTAAIAQTLVLPSSAGSTGQVMQINAVAAGVVQLGFAAAAVSGSGITSVVQFIFSTNANYNPSTLMSYAVIEGVGGGAGGAAAGGGSTNSGAGGGGGGGSGGYTRRTLAFASFASTETVTIGAGGAAGSSGGDTSLGTLLFARGGVQGSAGDAGGFGGNGGTGGTPSTAITTGDVNAAGNDGSPGGTSGGGSGGNGGNGGPSYMGGGGRGGAGAKGTSGGTGTAARAYGGGGGGGGGDEDTGSAGGAGASGVIVVTEFRSS